MTRPVSGLQSHPQTGRFFVQGSSISLLWDETGE